MTKLRNMLPWWLRIGAKIVLARLPISYGIWKRLKLFEHGDMNNPQRAFDTFVIHARTAGLLLESTPPRLKVCSGVDFTVLELGPGDSLFTAAIAQAMGANQSWLVDAGEFAVRDKAAHLRLQAFLETMGYPVAGAVGLTADATALLGAEHWQYLTRGTSSLAQIPDVSVDFCFSNAVLEHIPAGEFRMLTHELRRVLKPGGICVHRVDLKDHLGGGLSNLRFSENTWEGSLFRKSGFYTNRIRFVAMLDLFRAAGFNCQLTRIVRWEQLPIKRSALAEQFHHLPDDDLLVSGFDVVLRHRV